MIAFMSSWGRAACARVTAMAADPAAAGMALWLLAVLCLVSRSLARVLAGNARLPRLLLWWLAPRRWDVRAAVAANPRCPRLLLRWMSLSADWAVGAAVAGNPAASGRLLDRMARTAGARERLYLAGNPSLSAVVADRLLADADPFVRGAAAAHPAATAAGLTRLAHGMTEPAWTLKRIAANPSCPAGLSDQLLTWIALGGAGKADPMFDPVDCTGHPADTSVPAFRWYREQAGRDRAELHPLWRVRAEVLSAARRLPGRRAGVLARDPRPEVRCSIARARRLSLRLRLELRRDGDEVAARLARAAASRANDGPPDRWLLIRIVCLLIPPALIAMLLFFFLLTGNKGGSAPSLARPGSPAVLPGTATRELPGGGNVTCVMAMGDPPPVVVQVSAGASRLVLQFAGVVYAGIRQLLLSPDATVPAGQTAQFDLQYGSSLLTVTAPAQGRSAAVVVPVGGCG
jgi:hypothetical protein